MLFFIQDWTSNDQISFTVCMMKHYHSKTMQLKPYALSYSRKCLRSIHSVQYMKLSLRDFGTKYERKTSHKTEMSVKVSS